jgi:two-component system, chemotaxis family, response regulator PixH
MGYALIVDDSATERSIITSYLEQIGVKVSIAVSVEICRELKGSEHTNKIPIVLCSTKGTEMDKFWGMKQGADAYIPKPVDREELVRKVKELIA